MKGKKRIFVADDREVNRNGLRRLIESVPDLEYVGGAGTINQVIEQVRNLQPDVLLLDMKWGASQKAGEKILSRLREDRVFTKIVIYSSNPALLADHNRLRGYADFVTVSPYSKETLVAIINTLFPTEPHMSNRDVMKSRTAVLLLSLLAAICVLVIATFLILGGPTAENALVWTLTLFLVLSALFFFAIKMIDWNDLLILVKTILKKWF